MNRRLMYVAVLLCAAAGGGCQSACRSGGQQPAPVADTAEAQDSPDRARILAFRGQIRELRLELERREERRELIDRYWRALEIALATGLKASLSAEQLSPPDLVGNQGFEPADAMQPHRVARLKTLAPSEKPERSERDFRRESGI